MTRLEEYTKHDLLCYECSEEYANKIMALPNDTLYICTEDLQKSGFAIDYVGTIRQWACWTLEHLFVDDHNVEQTWLLNNTIEGIEDFYEILLEEVKE